MMNQYSKLSSEIHRVEPIVITKIVSMFTPQTIDESVCTYSGIQESVVRIQNKAPAEVRMVHF